MAEAGHAVASIRYTRVETRRVTWALLLSLAVHLTAWGIYELGKQYHWWELPRWPHWVQQLVKKVEPPPPPPPKTAEPALTFLDVSQESPDAPEKARYYSNKNSRAANAKPENNSDQPDIRGRQRDVPKTEDVSRPVFTKTPPAPPAPAQPTPEQAAAKAAAQAQKAAAATAAGDLAAGKPTPEKQTKPETATALQPRPRTLKQARAQQPRQLPGQAMMLPGGVHRIALSSSLDAKATPFGAYDAALVDAVTSCWWDLLESRQFAMDRTGSVTVHFRLNYDGTVSETEIERNNVGELLGYVCVNAIQKAAPFAPWPSDMRALIGENFRDITFTFYYY